MIDDSSRWTVTWGEPFVPGPARQLSLWQRMGYRMQGVWCRFEDMAELSGYRIKGAWRVLLGRSSWY